MHVNGDCEADDHFFPPTAIYNRLEAEWARGKLETTGARD